MATPSFIAAAGAAAAAAQSGTAAGVRRAKEMLGQAASRAVGADIPRPRPVAEALPAEPASGAMFLPARPQLSKQQVNALLRKLKTDGLTLEEMYWLTDAGAIPDSALSQLDNVATSSIELPDLPVRGSDNLSPNKAKGTAPKEAAVVRAKEELFGLTGPNSGEALPVEQITRTLKRLDKVLGSDEGRKAFYDLVAKNASDSQGAIADADRRIQSLRRLAGEDPDARDAARIDAAAESRDSAGAARLPAVNPVFAQQMADVTRSVARADLPDSMDAIAEAFNALPPDVRAGVAARAVRQNPFLTRAFTIDADGNTVSLSAESVSDMSAPRSNFERLMRDLKSAQDLGDAELEAAVAADVRREMDAMEAADPGAKAEAIRRYQERREAQDALRREIIASRPDVASDTAAARQASLSPGQPRMRAPGARSVEVAGPSLTDADMPTSFDDALARMRETVFESSIRQRNPLTAEEVKAVTNASGISGRNAPLALKPRLEVRAEYRDRGGVSNAEQNAIVSLREAQAERASASSPEAIAASEEKLRKVTAAFNRTFGGKDAKRSVDAEGDSVFLPGRARGDRSLNSDSPNETYWGLIDTVLGRRLRAGSSPARSDVEFSAAERAVNAKDAQRRLGYDPENTTAMDMMPQGGDVEDLEALGEGGKRGRLGGNQRRSRVQQAMQELFGFNRGRGVTVNPLDKEMFPEFEGDAVAVAEFLMRRPGNPRIEGTPEWNMAVEDLAKQISSEFTVKDVDPQVAGLPAVTSRPALPGPKPTAADINLDSSSIEIDAADDALSEFDRDMPPGARASGRGKGKGKGKGKGGKGKGKPVVVDAEKVEAVDPDAPLDEAATALEPAGKPFTANPEELRRRVSESTSSGTQVRDAMKNPPDMRKPKDDPTGKPKTDGGDGAPPKDPPKRLEEADGEFDKKPTPQSDSKPKGSLGRWLAGGGIALGAGLGIDAMMRGGGDGVANAGDLPIPPIPPGDGGSVVAGDEVSEDALTRALDRIRGSRRGPSTPTYQTLQNWTVWR